jgi:predicted HTH transcriptional regulator
MDPIKIEELTSTITNLISNTSTEGSYYDFKKQWYDPNKSAKILQDIICLANSPANKVSYLIIGVSDNHEITGVSDTVNIRKKYDELTDVINAAKFSGNIRPEFKVAKITIQGKRIDVIIIDSSSKSLPFFLEEKYHDSANNSVDIGIYSNQC